MSHHPFFAATGVAALLLVAGCSSDNSSSTSTTAAPSTSAASGTTAGTTAGSTPGTTRGTTPGSTPGTVTDASSASSDPCEALTAAEFSTAAGVTVTAELDTLTGACTYSEGTKSVAELTVLPAEGGAGAINLLEGFLEYPPPGATFEEVDAGDRAVVAGPPEARAVVVVGENGYDLTASSLTTAQLTALAQAIAAG